VQNERTILRALCSTSWLIGSSPRASFWSNRILFPPACPPKRYCFAATKCVAAHKEVESSPPVARKDQRGLDARDKVPGILSSGRPRSDPPFRYVVLQKSGTLIPRFSNITVAPIGTSARRQKRSAQKSRQVLSPHARRTVPTRHASRLKSTLCDPTDATEVIHPP
jgi:hypothetical protein